MRKSWIYLAAGLLLPVWLIAADFFLNPYSGAWLLILFGVFPWLLAPLFTSALVWYRPDVRASGRFLAHEALTHGGMYAACYLYPFFQTEWIALPSGQERSGKSLYTRWIDPQGQVISHQIAHILSFCVLLLVIHNLIDASYRLLQAYRGVSPPLPTYRWNHISHYLVAGILLATAGLPGTLRSGDLWLMLLSPFGFIPAFASLLASLRLDHRAGGHLPGGEAARQISMYAGWGLYCLEADRKVPLGHSGVFDPRDFFAPVTLTVTSPLGNLCGIVAMILTLYNLISAIVLLIRRRSAPGSKPTIPGA